MRFRLLSTAMLCLPLALVPTARADEVRDILDKAIKAHGGPDVLKTRRCTHTKSKGTIDILGGLEFRSEVSASPPRKFKEVVEMNVMGQDVKVITISNGKDVWINANGMNVELPNDKIKDMFENIANLSEIMQLVTLTDKKYTVTLIGEAKVNDKPAVGIKVAVKDRPDVDIYFDKATGLIAKTESKSVEPMSGNEVTEERIILEYQEVMGHKAAKRLRINHDGKKHVEVEILEMSFPEKFEDAEFSKP
jgi:hypothetical protein